MSNLKKSVAKMNKKIGKLFANNVERIELHEMRELEEKLANSAMDGLRLSSGEVDFDVLLDKVGKKEALTRREMKSLPYVIYDARCSEKIFRECFRLIDLDNKTVIKRLYYVYLAQYDKSRKTDTLARFLLFVLQAHLSNTSDRLLRKVLSLKDLLLAEAADRMRNMAEMIATGGTMENIMQQMGFSRTLVGCNFLAEAIKTFFEAKQYDLERQYEVFTDIAREEAYKVMLSFVIDRLILKIAAENSPKGRTYKKKGMKDFYKLLGDPRFGQDKVRWLDVSEDAKDIFISWLSERDLNLFFRVIEATNVDPGMWQKRKTFWKYYLPYMTNTWVFLGKEAVEKVEQSKKMDVKFGRLGKGAFLPNHSVFTFQIGNYVFAEWSHNGKLRIWEKEDAPNFFARDCIDRKEIMVDCFRYLVHSGNDNYNWQKALENWLWDYCGIERKRG